MASQDEWQDRLCCPRCGFGDVGMLVAEETYPTIRHGLPAGEWKMPGRACCRLCKCEFQYESEEAGE